ncbi:DNA-directed RNA polymerase [Candidatus Woesearchaeota archaeon]|nr:DNA-directed RNA polymerase [Candidatus Woesearchaeota archaeon]|tara:strand:- start:82 stop:630 length:549 start_codon:yes stop_codon:yes gene_type:complete
MFYKIKVKDHVRVPPNNFGKDLNLAIIEEVRNQYGGYISKDLGIVIDVDRVDEVGEGIIIPGDGASYYSTTFSLLSYKPELQEIVKGKIKDIADFGAFITVGPIEGMIHISQTMNDFVSFSKDKVLIGKETKRSLKVNDKCHARVIAISFKDTTNPKIGLTMRQAGLGREDWVVEDIKKEKK